MKRQSFARALSLFLAIASCNPRLWWPFSFLSSTLWGSARTPRRADTKTQTEDPVTPVRVATSSPRPGLRADLARHHTLWRV